MSRKGFVVKTNDDRTPNGRGYSRGHFDIVVLNPDFARAYAGDYDTLNGQHWRRFQSNVIDAPRPKSQPPALYLFELMLNRKPFGRSGTGARGRRTRDDFVRTVIQDWDKLEAARSHPDTGYSFSNRVGMLVFDNALPRDAAEHVRGAITREGVELFSHVLAARPAAG